jgi:hypothetical protein
VNKLGVRNPFSGCQRIFALESLYQQEWEYGFSIILKLHTIMLKKTVFGLFGLSVLFFCLGGCEYNNVSDLPIPCDATSEVSFANDIVPIMSGSCSSASTACHSANSASGIPLDTYIGVKEQVDFDKLYSSIIWDGNASQMPKGSSSKIDTCSIGKVERWIAAGAPNN